jgi:uncharacterized protein with ATP-grasp and redox domains
MTRREGLPVTSAARTIIDVAASGIAEEQIRKTVHEAIRQGMTGKEELLCKASHRSGKVQRILDNIFDSETK